MLLKLHGKALKILFKQLDDKATFQAADQKISAVNTFFTLILVSLELIFNLF